MKQSDDPIDLLTDELTALRRSVENLARTSLSKDEAEALSEIVSHSCIEMHKTANAVKTQLQEELRQATVDIRQQTMDAAKTAARQAIEKSHEDSLKAAQSLSKAAGEARREAWRYFGGFWVWLLSMLTTGALLGALAAVLITGRGDAQKFGQYPGIYCSSANGTVVKQADGSSYCAVWIKK